MANNTDILGEEAAARQIICNNFFDTDGVFEDDTVTCLKHSAFRGRTNLRSAIFPSLIRFGNTVSDKYDGFYGCVNLSCVDFGGGDSLSNTYLQDCSFLTDIFLRKESAIISLLNQNVFTGTRYATNSGDNGCSIYVPRNLISTYQTATNWSVLYAAHTDLFKAIEDYTVDGTVTGDIDWSLIDPVETPVYSGENLVFDGKASSVIDTGIQLFATTTPKWTILVDFNHQSMSGMNNGLFSCYNTSADRGIHFCRSGAQQGLYVLYKIPGVSSSFSQGTGGYYNNRYRLVVTLYGGVMEVIIIRPDKMNLYRARYVGSTPASTLTETLKIGKNPTTSYWEGTVNKFKVYDKILNARQIWREFGI